MSKNEHVTAIRRLAYPDHPFVVGPISAQRIVRHLDALARQLEELETNRVADPPAEMVKGDTSVKAGFADGWGGWVGIAADRYSHMVRIMTRDSDGSNHYVCFLPHERDKVLRAFTEAFDDIGDTEVRR